jgi:prepilin-type processing-associated H-X9-DG protein
LLVVIAIIAILIGLLLPAIQKVREASDRSTCQNNLKQLGLAVQSYHDGNGKVPPGGANDQADFGGAGAGSTSVWGSSWLVYILPQIEQNTLFVKWQFSGQSGVFNTTNNANMKGLIIKSYLCPSSSLTVAPAPSRTESFMPSYVGVSGAAPNTIPGYTESRFNNMPCGGQVGAGGVLFPNGKVRFSDVKDGTSNTITVGEQGDFLVDTTGAKQEWRASQLWGWTLGVKAPGVPPNFSNAGGDNRSPNLTTVRYQVNYSPAGGWTNDVAGLGVGQSGNCTGANVPMNSAHPGGVNVAVCDGSVRFLKDSTPLSVLAQLATRDDRTPLPDF